MAKRKKVNRKADDSGVEEGDRLLANGTDTPVSTAHVDSVILWTCQDVAQWLSDIGLPEYSHNFCTVSTRVFLLLDHNAIA